ncbi:hypothetical protein CC86DRAFT_411967 [Ophiobolus disseminans]|uniref:Uncharacterized protein n=1 Tax=Ophiobolus disseminans TaxID=1469910 RepID=A0A6A6ZKD1_9PLEO|nr:hypothetical protein CC86DRAFT_411967 [Ophiobolus disseminans]
MPLDASMIEGLTPATSLQWKRLNVQHRYLKRRLHILRGGCWASRCSHSDIMYPPHPLSDSDRRDAKIEVNAQIQNVTHHLDEMSATIDATVLSYAQTTCYALTQAIHTHLPRELRDIIFSRLIHVLDIASPPQGNAVSTYRPASRLIANEILSHFDYATPFYHPPGSFAVPHFLDPVFAPQTIREEILEIVANQSTGSSAVPILNSRFAALRALDTRVPASWFFPYILVFRVPVKDMWASWSAELPVTPDSIAAGFAAHVLGLLCAIQARRTQWLEVEFRLKGLRYAEKVAFRRGVEGAVGELEGRGWRDVTVWWKWGKDVRVGDG